MQHDRDNPPNFPLTGRRRTTEYPNRGVKTGPAWRAMWKLLWDAPGPLVGADVDFVGAAASECSPWTAKLLLTRARASGLLDVNRPMLDSRSRVVYRISQQADEKPWDRITAQEWVLDWMERSGTQRLRDAALAERARVS